jgi:arylsulfatase A-like enzyme
VLNKIKELGLEKDTLVFFFSDNGGPTRQTTSGNGPLRGFKSQTWEGGIRVPFLVQWKGRLPAGRSDDRPVIQLDILPTALAAAGVRLEPEWNLDGVNLLPYLTGEQDGAPHDALYWRFGPQVAIRKGDWKLVKGAGSANIEGIERRAAANMEGAELYHLAADLGETRNLAEQQPEKVQELAADWNRWNERNVEALWIPQRGGQRRPNRANR